jgi:hypothetical protein
LAIDIAKPLFVLDKKAIIEIILEKQRAYKDAFLSLPQ